jgi:hypothetical protein
VILEKSGSMENAKDSVVCTPTGIQLHKKLLHDQDSTKVSNLSYPHFR